MKLTLTLFLLINPLTMVMSQDWANLNYYRKENVELLHSPENEARIVFFGNSITEGWSKLDSSFFKGRPFVNRGISGQTTPQMLVRFRQDVISLKPKIVVILAGINDIAGNTGPSSLEMIQDNLASMAEIATANNVRVILSSILPANKFAWKPEIQPASSVIAMNEWIKTYSREHKHIYLDYYSAMVDSEKGLPPALSHDGVHPNLAGYRVMEPLLLQAIESVTKSEMKVEKVRTKTSR